MAPSWPKTYLQRPLHAFDVPKSKVNAQLARIESLVDRGLVDVHRQIRIGHVVVFTIRMVVTEGGEGRRCQGGGD